MNEFREPRSDPKMMERMRLTFELSAAADAMKRQQFRRKYPCESDEEIDRRMAAWRSYRPGAEHGDASGPEFRVSNRLDHLKK